MSLFPSLSSLQPLPATLPKPLPCPSTLSSRKPLFPQIVLLHTYISVVYVCVCTNIHGHNLLNLVLLVGGASVTWRPMTLRWTTNQETHLWERSILLLQQSYGTWSSLSRDETHENFPSRLKMSTDVAIVSILFTQPSLGENGSQQACWHCHFYNHPMTSSEPSMPELSDKCIHWIWAPHRLWIIALCPVVDFRDRLHSLQREASLTRDGSYTHQ